MATTLGDRPRTAPSLGDVRRAMHRHVLAVSSTLPQGAGWAELRDHCRALVSADLFTFAASAIRESILLHDAAASRRRLFPEWLVAVTVLPARRRPANYLALLDALSEPAYRRPEGRHVAHWVAFADGHELDLRLTVIPNHRVSAAPLLLPVELLTPAERELLRLRPAA